MFFHFQSNKRAESSSKLSSNLTFISILRSTRVFRIFFYLRKKRETCNRNHRIQCTFVSKIVRERISSSKLSSNSTFNVISSLNLFLFLTRKEKETYNRLLHKNRIFDPFFHFQIKRAEIIIETIIEFNVHFTFHEYVSNLFLFTKEKRDA